MKYILLACLLISFNATAYTKASLNCIKKLTYDLNVDSRAFKVNMDEVDIDLEDKPLEESIALIRATLELYGCNSRNAINFSKTPSGRAKSRCLELVPGQDYSMSCYIESNIGFFFITKDLQTDAFIIYSRWD
ncbi:MULTISPECIES: hypothetical protein [Halobacteriovorax]|uniref:Uncharacterized protein n=1 Tax=Halobacteriovorax vibrionivorans TaxID=2152716 RepID=A0ABY0IIX7_9BACT|nr:MULTISPECIES: hypothetical protein [Halobacteriovorax]AYF45506.1 hypothetical protein BALOs_2509 [Halobacteriovorax sp. BALOs_7]RZF22572.1 hypothetical protein DAY19_02025 [Halobacteriovorax vibrionivorans]TGD47765.1 hypothetical protein EP118_07390 [Halobacteriovorax sp. Y22]